MKVTIEIGKRLLQRLDAMSQARQAGAKPYDYDFRGYEAGIRRLLGLDEGHCPKEHVQRLTTDALQQYVEEEIDLVLKDFVQPHARPECPLRGRHRFDGR